MFAALAIAIVVGAVVGGLTILDRRLRIADEARIALLVGISGAVAGWALVDPVTGLSDGVGLAGILGPLIGALGLAAYAWRGRRRTFNDLGLSPHSD